MEYLEVYQKLYELHQTIFLKYIMPYNVFKKP